MEENAGPDELPTTAAEPSKLQRDRHSLLLALDLTTRSRFQPTLPKLMHDLGNEALLPGFSPGS